MPSALITARRFAQALGYQQFVTCATGEKEKRHAICGRVAERFLEWFINGMRRLVT
jgi:hypothetical protein